MSKKGIKIKNRERINSIKSKGNGANIAYRLKCAKTANGLSHFVMYGDLLKEKTPL